MRTFGNMLVLEFGFSFRPALGKPGTEMGASHRDVLSLSVRSISLGVGSWSLFLGLYRSSMLTIKSAYPLFLRLHVVLLGSLISLTESCSQEVRANQ